MGTCSACALSQAGYLPGYALGLFVCLLLAVGAGLAIWWAVGTGQFRDVEGIKFRMMAEDDRPPDR